jgi:hypothetical protein
MPKAVIRRAKGNRLPGEILRAYSDGRMPEISGNLE